MIKKRTEEKSSFLMSLTKTVLWPDTVFSVSHLFNETQEFHNLFNIPHFILKLNRGILVSHYNVQRVLPYEINISVYSVGLVLFITTPH